MAIQRAVKLDNDLTAGTFRTVPKTTTIASAVDNYLAYVATLRRVRKTIGRYRGELHTFRDFCGEHHIRLLAQVNVTLFDSYRANLQTVHAPRTLYHESVVVAQFMKWCASRDLISRNPLTGYKLEKPHLEPRPGPSLAEVQRLLFAANPGEAAVRALGLHRHAKRRSATSSP